VFTIIEGKVVDEFSGNLKDDSLHKFIGKAIELNKEFSKI
jgi:thioredoxin-like negative regulator of GroEL